MAIDLTDAVNACLRGIGAAPVANADDDNLDSAIALQTIEQVSRDIQSVGWWFNKEKNWRLTPDTNGIILTPNNAIDVIDWGASREAALAIRGTKMYDTDSHTHDLRSLVLSDGTIEFMFIMELQFTDLPPQAQYAVMYQSRRMFAQDVEGDAQRWKFTNYDEEKALSRLQAAEMRNKKSNFLNHNSTAANLIAKVGGQNGGVYAANFPTASRRSQY